MTLLSVRNLTFSYGHKNVFECANFDASCSNVTGIIGSNGAGKSTFFDLITGLKRPDSGYISRPVVNSLYLSQVITMPATLKMSDIYHMICLLATNKESNIHRSITTLESLDFRLAHRFMDVYKKPSAICSYGEKRWFLTLTLLSLDAEMVVLDEPTAGVDPEFRRYIWQGIKSAARRGTAILIASHNIEEIVKNCDEFFVLSARKLKRYCTGSEFMAEYETTDVDDAFIAATSER